MLPFDTVHAITGCLIDADARADTTDWGNPPVLFVLHEHRLTTHDTTSTYEIWVEPIAVAPQRWLDHPTGIAGVLTELATNPTPPGHPDRPDGTQLLAWAVIYEDIRADTTDLAEIRRVDAIDTDHRSYQISHLRGEDRAVVVIDDHPTPARTSTTHAGLTALLGPAHRP